MTFTVHQYCRALSPPPPSAAILRAGREFIAETDERARWIGVKPALGLFLCTIGNNAFAYSIKPPLITRTEVSVARNLAVLKEWSDHDALDDASNKVQDLEEFECESNHTLPTALEFWPDVLVTRVREIAPDSTTREKPHEEVPTAIKDAQPSSSDDFDERPWLDVCSLFTAVPEPHFHPPPAPPSLTVDLPYIPPYRKSQPVPIHPNNVLNMQEYLDTPFNRSVWIVPIRGALPWGGSSAALVSSQKSRLAAEPPARGEAITWTRPYLASFWDALLTIRNAYNLGPISLSFHATTSGPRPPAGSLSLDKRSYGSPVLDEDLGADLHRRPLVAVDHIKIYHDSKHAMAIRNILDAWGYQSKNREEKARVKVRVLRGARLVLVDDRLKGILIA